MSGNDDLTAAGMLMTLGWLRLSPGGRNEDEERGLRGTVHDPLWLLSRQRQLYEFRGEDAGSPVEADVTVDCDEIRTVELRGDDLRDDGEETEVRTIPYDGGPLESLVEREPVMTATSGPNARLRAEAGSSFLRLLADVGYGRYAASDFPESFLLERPDDPMEAGDRQYFRVMEGRALDGRAVVEALESAVDDLGDEEGPSWSGVSSGDLPLPEGGSATDAYREAATAFYGWYRDLYDEPTERTGMGWESERLEYDATIETGFGGTAARFEASAYAGGHLDWRSFSPVEERTPLDFATLDPTMELARAETIDAGSREATGEIDVGSLDAIEGLDAESVDLAGAVDTGRVELPDDALPDSTEGPIDAGGTIDAGGLETSEIDLDASDLDAGDPTTPLPDDFDLDDLAGPDVDVELPPDAADLDFWRTTVERETIPIPIDFPGIPARRWWEFADSSMALENLPVDGVGIARTLILEYGVEFGADWFRIPVELPLGTFARVTDLRVTDSFGITAEAEPVAPVPGSWRLFTCWTASHDEPGLLLPPTLSHSIDSDPFERVLFGRDEMANLAFGLERLIEGPTGRPLDRTEFHRPELVVEAVVPAPDPDEEYVSLTNPGDDSVDLEGVAVERHDDGEPIHVFDETDPARLGPGESIRVYTGYPPGDGLDDGDDARAWAEREASVWADAEAVDVRDLAAVDDAAADPSGADDALALSNGLLARKLLERPDADGSYRLSTAVPPHWFPFTMDYDDEDAPTIADPDADYRLQLALLLDGETLDAPVGELPRPEGKILAPEDGSALRLYEEEVTRSGREVVRRYQHARWTDGSTHLWSGRRSTPGAGELASGLRFDVLEDG